MPAILTDRVAPAAAPDSREHHDVTAYARPIAAPSPADMPMVDLAEEVTLAERA